MLRVMITSAMGRSPGAAVKLDVKTLFDLFKACQIEVLNKKLGNQKFTW